jgi:hypothetical protein
MAFENAVGVTGALLDRAINRLNALNASADPATFAKELLNTQIEVGIATSSQQNLTTTIGEIFRTQKAVAAGQR